MGIGRQHNSEVGKKCCIYTAGVDGICIVSSDSDYTRLATRIREKNLFVMGIGRSNTPRAFVNACDIFVYTENLQSTVEAIIQTEISTPDAAKTDTANSLGLEGLLQTAFDSAVQDDGWASLAMMGSFLRQIDPAFDPRTYGYKLLSQLVKDFHDFIEVKSAKARAAVR
jgi:hypothetical protein